MTPGLSYAQAPPFSLPLRFFLTAPLFLLAAGGLIACAPEALASRWTPAALALAHALTLGFLGQTMLGALTQVLPVVAGAPLPFVRPVARFAHVALAGGTAALLAGFLTAAPLAAGVALVLLGAGIMVFLAALAASLVRAARGPTTAGVRLASLALLLVAVLGGMLAWPRAGGAYPPNLPLLIDTHLAFGLLGWILLLVVAVALQVVPMFQITPVYPAWLARGLPALLFALLLLRSAAQALPAFAGAALDAGIAFGVLAFALVTLDLQRRRRRRLADTTLDFWRLAMVSLIACVAAWSVARAVPAWAAHDAYPLLLGVLFLGGFATSVVSGMLYKIVPFLAWFHLQSQLQARAGSIPTMKDMIAEGRTRLHFRLHLSACLLLALATAWPQLVRPAGIVLVLSAALQGANLHSAVARFKRHGGRLGA
ncbi:MAG: hypothetical protein AB1593_07065 [Pseudomonadota bacterium]